MFAPEVPLELDKQVFSDTLRSSRRGLSSGLSGSRNEYLKLVLEDDVAVDLLFAAASRLAHARVPECIISAMKMSKLTATLKPNGRVRGLSAGEVFRRLTSKCIARHMHYELREAVSALNFGLSNRSGTDALVHFLQYLSDARPNKVIMSIDGVGAFDHICRARIFEQLADCQAFHKLIPFVRQWYSDPSVFVWIDAQGRVHVIRQGDGGEQGDALMPALSCLGLKPALDAIRARLPAGAFIVAYLDDIHVVCDPDDVHELFCFTRDTLQEVCCIDVNLGKLAAWSKNIQPPPENLPLLGNNVWRGDLPEPDRGLKVVGTPVGTNAYMNRISREAVNEEVQLLETLPQLASLQVSWLLLYMCAVPRLNHLL